MLSDDWLVSEPYDLEYKQYLILDFLKKAEDCFSEYKLYPHLAELIKQHNNLSQIKVNKENIRNSFPKELVGIDLENMALVYNEILNENTRLILVDDLIDYSLPKLEYVIQIGIALYEQIEKEINLFNFFDGINNQRGYLFFNGTSVKTYQYELSKIKDHNGVNILKTQPSKRYDNMGEPSYASILERIIQSDGVIPTTYIVEYKSEYPLIDTVMPIVKRTLVSQLLR